MRQELCLWVKPLTVFHCTPPDPNGRTAGKETLSTVRRVSTSFGNVFKLQKNCIVFLLFGILSVSHKDEPLDAFTETRIPPRFRLAHREAVQWRRTQIQGSDTSDDNDEIDDIEWGPATEL